MTTSVLIATEIGDFGGEILDAGFRKDETFVVVAAVALVGTTASAATTGSMGMVAGEVGLSVFVVVVSGGIDLTGWIACVVGMMAPWSRIVISMTGIFGGSHEAWRLDIIIVIRSVGTLRITDVWTMIIVNTP